MPDSSADRLAASSRRLVYSPHLCDAGRPCRRARRTRSICCWQSPSTSPARSPRTRRSCSATAIVKRSSLISQVLAAITGGMLGAIGIAYFEWANHGFQEVVVPWTRIGNPADAQAWSARLGQAPYQSVYGTSLSGALEFRRRAAETGAVRRHAAGDRRLRRRRQQQRAASRAGARRVGRRRRHHQRPAHHQPPSRASAVWNSMSTNTTATP